MTITCNVCNQNVSVKMYFYSITITKEHGLNTFNEIYYRASCSAKTICPNCGGEINKMYSRSIDNEDIIKLATGREDIK